MDNTKKINETVKSGKHLLDRIDYVRTRETKAAPEKEGVRGVIGRVTNIRSRQNDKYSPKNSVIGRQSVRRRKRNMEQAKYAEAADFIKSVMNKPVEDVIKRASAIHNPTIVMVVLDRLIDKSGDNEYNRIKKIVNGIFEDIGDNLGPYLAVIDDEQSIQLVEKFVNREARFINEYHSGDAIVWTECVEDNKFNVMKYYVRSNKSMAVFSEALDRKNVMKRYDSSKIL